MKIVAFAASNSRQSINKQLATYAAGLVKGAEVEVLDLNDYEMPIFSEDRERESGIPLAAYAFLERIGGADALVISYAEHNGSFSAAYKNIVDWASRATRNVFANKPTLMLATSPGVGGGASVLALAEKSAPYMGAEVIRTLSVPRFHEQFGPGGDLAEEADTGPRLAAAVKDLEAAISVSETSELSAVG